MLNPVAIPSGGMTIFRSVTAVRASRSRQAMTPTRPASETKIDTPEGNAMLRF